MIKKILCLIALTSLSFSIQANNSADISENNLIKVEEMMLNKNIFGFVILISCLIIPVILLN